MAPSPSPRPTSTAQGRTCPSCAAFVPKGRKTCESCRLAVDMMDGFAAAKRAAMQRGVGATKVESGPVNVWPYVKIAFLVLVLAAAGWGVYKITRPKPPRWAQFPGTGVEAVQQFLTRISAGEDKSYDAAYSQIADSVREPNNSDERGNYRQVFHSMNLYLSGEFGADWITNTKLEADPADPNTIIAHVALETLHIQVANQEKPDPTTSGPHYGILRINEFNVNDAAAFRQMAGIEGIIKGAAGQAAVDNIELIRGAGSAPRYETAMQKKVRMLPIVRNPRTTSWQAIIKLYPIRKDPVVRNRLEQIMNDDRYEPVMKEKANALLKDRVDETDLAAADVNE